MADVVKMFRIIFLAISISFLFNYGQVEGVAMQITPSTVNIVGQSTSNPPYPTITPAQVVFTCSPQGTSGVEGLIYLKIARRGTDNMYVDIAEITFTNPQAKRSDSAPSDIVQKNPTISGNLQSGNAMGSSLRMEFRGDSLTCTDGASYRCSMHYMTTGNNVVLQATSLNTLNVRVIPGNLVLTARQNIQNFPQTLINNTALASGTMVEFTCTGTIGENSLTMLEWKRSLSGTSGSFFEPYSPPNSADLTTGNPSSSCPYTRTSTLRYTTSSVDRFGVAFRCDVGASTGGFQTAQSPQFLISSVTSAGREITPRKVVHLVCFGLFAIASIFII